MEIDSVILSRYNKRIKKPHVDIIADAWEKGNERDLPKTIHLKVITAEE